MTQCLHICEMFKLSLTSWLSDCCSESKFTIKKRNHTWLLIMLQKKREDHFSTPDTHKHIYTVAEKLTV